MRIIPWWVKQCRWLQLDTINSSQAFVICWCDIFIVKVRCCRCCRMHSSHRWGPSRSPALCHRLRLRLLFQRDLWDLILKIRLHEISSLYVHTWPGNSAHVAAVTICLKWCLHYFFLISLCISLHCCYEHYGWKSIFGSTGLFVNVSKCDLMRIKCGTVAISKNRIIINVIFWWLCLK